MLAANEQQKQDEAAERDRIIGIGTMRPLEEEEVRRVPLLAWPGLRGSSDLKFVAYRRPNRTCVGTHAEFRRPEGCTVLSSVS